MAVYAEIQIVGHGVAGDTAGESVLQPLSANRQHRMKLYLVAVASAGQFAFKGPPTCVPETLFLFVLRNSLWPVEPHSYWTETSHLPAISTLGGSGARFTMPFGADRKIRVRRVATIL